MAGFFKRISEYIKHGVWQKDDAEFDNRKSLWLTRQLRLIVYTIRGVGQHATFIRASALTFYTIMSIVPILALAFGVIKGFGLDVDLGGYLIDRFPEYERIAEFAGSVLDRTKGGIVALTGFVILIWAAVRVFSNVEDAFNNIWEVKKPRSLARKITAYAAVIFMLPIALVVISAIVAYIQNFFGQYKYLSGKVFYYLVPIAIMWLLFFAMYKIIPNTKVKARNAAKAALIASIGFLVFQAIYVYIQSSVNAYNVIYGSFAAIPLLLIWMQTSWIIILIGGELSFSFQNMDSYRQERDALLVSYDNRRKITVAVMLVIVKHFNDDSGLPTSEEIAKYLKLPLRIVRDVISNLEDAGLVVAIRTGQSDKVRRYIPAHDTSDMKFYGILQATEAVGTKITSRTDVPEMHEVNAILDEIKERVSESDTNVLLSTLLKNEKTEDGNTGER